MKTIRVVAAIIRKDNKIFATQRGYGDFKDGWEFPGGKIEEGESPEHAIAREIKEELNADIIVGDLLTTVEYDYPNFHLSMDCFWAELAPDSHMELLEHEAAKWLSIDEIDSVDWLPADVEVVKKIKERVKRMLLIDLAEEELKYLDDIKNQFPDNIIIKKTHGFDGESSVQVVIDVASILKESIPYIVAVVEAILLYRINKLQAELKNREVELEAEKIALEKEKASRVSLEIRASSNGECQYLIKAEDAEKALSDPKKLRQLIDELPGKLEVLDEKPKAKDKKAKK